VPVAPCTPDRLHAAIILDGSGRWAVARGKPRPAGHAAGVEAVRRVVAAAPGLGIGTLSLFAFSSHNWARPTHEVAALLTLLEDFLREDAPGYRQAGVRIRVIGRRDRLPGTLRAAMAAAESATGSGKKLMLRLAVDYSSRQALLRAACRMYTATEVSEEAFARLLAAAPPEETSTPDVDLLIRTGGEQRLSDFLLWECAHAELVFVRKLWPDFAAEDLAAVVREYHARDRRFGRVPEAVAG